MDPRGLALALTPGFAVVWLVVVREATNLFFWSGAASAAPLVALGWIVLASLSRSGYRDFSHCCALGLILFAATWHLGASTMGWTRLALAPGIQTTVLFVITGFSLASVLFLVRGWVWARSRSSVRSDCLRCGYPRPEGVSCCPECGLAIQAISFHRPFPLIGCVLGITQIVGLAVLAYYHPLNHMQRLLPRSNLASGYIFSGPGCGDPMIVVWQEGPNALAVEMCIEAPFIWPRHFIVSFGPMAFESGAWSDLEVLCDTRRYSEAISCLREASTR